jgi:hypothetical protein
MHVYDLQQFLRSLSQPLRTSGAKAAADDLDRAGAALEPFRDLTVSQFADFLAQAEQYARTGIVPTTGRAKGTAKAAAKGSDPQALANAIENIRLLYDRVTSPDVTYSTIDTEVKQLDKRFKKDEVMEIARALGIQGSLKSKRDAVEEIKLRLTERKESFQRTQF